MGAQNNPAYRPWARDEDQYLLDHATETDAAIGLALGRSKKGVNARRHRVAVGVNRSVRVRTAEATAKFQATMAARSQQTRDETEARVHGWPEPDAVTWDQLLKGRTFGTPTKSGTAVKFLRVSYSGASMVGCAAAMCSEVA